MAKTLKDLCKPRESVFDKQRRDTVLDIADLTSDKIDPELFFAENYMTGGMETLLTEGFRRLEGVSNQGIFRLNQAMGGGKTHNLISFGLLAKYPEYREKVMDKFYKASPDLGPVKVVVFSGRESDAPLGIWGSIAEQLGKGDHFKDHYQPLRAPGQTAWERLLEGERVLILLDELPPYFENARSIAIGDSNLAKVTETALSNLLTAVGRESCHQVCLVITELKMAHEEGGTQLAKIIREFEKETHRIAMNLVPVELGSDELYHILRKRLFDELPNKNQISEVAQAYAKAIRDAKQMEITNESPEGFASRVESAYPFHPAIKDLYARFRENPGFQQTRGLIRLMRIIVSRMYQTGEASNSYLISAHDLDLNDNETRSEINQVNPNLANAIAHDIAADGHAEAEKLDANLGGTDAQDVCRLLLMASLANIPNAVIGLSIPELIAYLAEPNRDLSRLQTDVLEKLAIHAWYMHSDRDGKLFFKNTQNLNAKLEDLVRTYLPEQATKELRAQLKRLFEPTVGNCYQKVLPLPAVDEIELNQDQVTLVISEPYSGVGLKPELQSFFEGATWKNRLAILTGSQTTYETMIETGKRMKAIQQILTDFETNKIAQTDPQLLKAQELNDKIKGNFYSAVRETFTTLYYPSGDQNNVLMSAAITMQFDGNKYDGEMQIQNLLKEKMKFETDVESDIFRKKLEARLFTTQTMTWAEIRRRAGMFTNWQWHHPRALENLKEDCLRKEIWREDGGYLDKGPFPQPKTSVMVTEINRNDDTGETTLRLTPVYADQVFYDFGAEATTGSAKLEGLTLTTKELRISFLSVDSTGEHETGNPVAHENRITLKYKTYQSGNQKKMILESAPEAAIYYSTDGSDPINAGATYDEEIILSEGTTLVLAAASRDGINSEVLRIPISWDPKEAVKVDPNRSASWSRKFSTNETKDTYALIEKAKRHGAKLAGVKVTIQDNVGKKEWVELATFPNKVITPEQLENVISVLREIQTSGQVILNVEYLVFDLGQGLLDWADEDKISLKPGEVKQ